ncbi:MAG TPA: hypothetical protein VGB57_09075 [Allosphingosinicella sp.]|jgi:Na+/H+ antiporter NhaD/arsenite permease-like protein
MSLWSWIIALAALLFSIGCFCLFVLSATRTPVPDKVVEDAAKRAEVRSLSPAALGALVKALADAFSKVGPSALALIGAILFLLLAGEASEVFHLTDAPEKAQPTKPRAGEQNRSAGSTAGNESREADPAANGQ